MDESTWPLIIAGLALALSFVTAIILPFGKWVASRWRAVRHAERELRLRAEAELLEKEKECAILEVKLKYCEAELEGGG